MSDFEISDDIFRDIIEGSIEKLFQKKLSIREKDFNAKSIEYQPVWTLGEEGDKDLKYLKVRKTGVIKFQTIESMEILDTGATCEEVIDYLLTRKSTKVKPILR